VYKRLLIFLLLVIGPNVFGQNNTVDRPRINGLFLVGALSPFLDGGELHVAYEVAMNRKKRSSILFEGFAGLTKKNLNNRTSTLGDDERITRFDSSKRNFGLGIHVRKYGFDAPYSWYIGLLSNFRRYHYKIAEGRCSNPNDEACEVSIRNLTVKSEITRFGFDFGFNAKLSRLVFLNVSSEFGVQNLNNERSLLYDFAVEQPIFFPRNFRRSGREIIQDPGGEPHSGLRGFASLRVSIGFAIR